MARNLCQMVRNDDLPSDLRLCAYNGVFQILRYPWNKRPLVLAVKGEFVFPDDVDWPLVDGLLASNSG